MSQVALVYPLLVQVALTFVLLFWMAKGRTSLLANDQIRPEQIALGQPGWPQRETQISNSFRNQFEAPVLFYVLVLLVLHLRMSDIVHVVLAWAFVLLRIAHAYIHTTSNDVRVRGPTYGIGVFVLLIMWVWFAIRFLMASAPV
jgi:hypothetical protein